MTWVDLEKCFTRSIAHTFSRKKLLFVFSALFLCGLLVVFFRAIAFETSDWVAMSLTFLPILLSSGVLLSLGVLLVRIHLHEVKQLTWSFRRLFSGSIQLIFGTLYLSVPPILIYLFLWVILGIFWLLCEIPGIGDFFRIVMAFAPFLIILCSLLLCLFNLALLFFVAPAVATESRSEITERLMLVLRGRLFTAFALFLVALIPIALVVGFLCLAAFLTNVNFLVATHSISVALQWFFIMIPFCALLTPAVLLFFNFSAECYWLLSKETVRT